MAEICTKQLKNSHKSTLRTRLHRAKWKTCASNRETFSVKMQTIQFQADSQKGYDDCDGGGHGSQPYRVQDFVQL